MKVNWESIKDVIGGAAPVVGSLLGGSAGSAVGELVATALGVENTPEAVASAVQSDPEAATKLRELELTHKTRLEELRLEAEKARLADVQNARSREVQLAQAGKSNVPLYTLATAVVIGFFAIVFILIFKSAAIPDGTREVAFLLLGTLSTSFGAVIQYFFGSSKGSSDKQEYIARISGGGK